MNSMAVQSSYQDHSYFLMEFEAEGWRLEHMAAPFQETGTTSPSATGA